MFKIFWDTTTIQLSEKIKFKTAYQVMCVDFDTDKVDFKPYIMYDVKEVKQNGEIIWNTEVFKYQDSKSP